MLRVAILDHCSKDFRPISDTRPVAELLAGCFTFEDRIRRLFPNSEVSVVPYKRLSDAETRRSAFEGLTLYLEANFVYTLEFARIAMGLDSPAVFISDGAVVGVAAEEPFQKSWFEDPPNWPTHNLTLMRVDAIWDLVNLNGEIIKSDFEEHFRRAIDGQVHPLSAIYGENAIAIERGAEIFAGAVLDAREGPIVVARGAVVRPGAVIQGPCYIGPDTMVLSGWAREGCSFGPMCKIGGEVESSIFLGYSNKCHEGFVGHSYIGRWVNLGALTTTSDLKNNYSKIRVDLGEGERDTGRIKVGSFFGDHTKTGIGTLLNSGTCLGVSVNHYASGLPPKFIRAFSWGTSEGYTRYEFDKALATARIVMSRRGIKMGASEAELLLKIYRENWPES